MSNIFVNVTGNGSAWVDNPTPNNGDIITLYAYENTGASLIDITATDYQGCAIALATTNVQQFQYDSTWGDMTINVVFSHDIITVYSTGNGWATVDNPNPNHGDSVRLSCTPGSRKDKVSSIIVTDSNSNSWQLPAIEDQYFTYDSSWGDITIDVYFDLKWIFRNLWILKQREWWRKNNY